MTCIPWAVWAAALSHDTAEDLPRYKQSFHLQRGFGTPVDKRPALFSYSSSRVDGVSYSIEAELVYAREPVGDMNRGLGDYTMSFDGAVNLAQDSDAEDAVQWEFALGRLDKRPDVGGPQNANARKFFRQYKLSYQTDRKWASQKIAFAPRWSIVDLPKGIGGFPSGQSNKGRIFVSLNPTVGFDIGRVIKSGATLEDQGTLSRIVGEGSINAFVPSMNSVFYAEAKGNFLPLQSGRKGFSLLRFGVQIGLDKQATSNLVVEYKVGEDAPEFKRVDVYRIALGVKF